MQFTEVLQKIKSSLNLVEIIGEHVVLRKSGSNYSGLCPFHSEKTPSFYVNEKKQLFHCYGCQKGGDLFTFVMEIQGLSFRESVEELAERVKIPLPEEWGTKHSSQSPQQQDSRREQKTLAYRLNRFAGQYYHQQLQQSKEALQYLYQRGVSKEIIQSFYLGATASNLRDGLFQFLKNHKAPLNLAIELGLIRPDLQGGYRDLFRKRILFPILDLSGKIAGFGGRIFKDEESPKYINSLESFLFRKSQLTFGLYQAQRHVREKNELILVEGYFDVLAMHQCGFQNTIATCGTSLSSHHLKILSKLASRIIILFDGDTAGQEAMERAMEVGLEEGIVLHGITLPNGMDPDTFLLDRQGKEKMADYIQGAISLLDSRIHDMIRLSFSGSEGRTVALKKMGGWLSKFQDPIGKEVRIQHIRSQLGSLPSLLTVSPSNASKRLAQRFLLKSDTPKRLSQIDKTILSGLFLGGVYLKILERAEKNLPPATVLGDILQSEAAKIVMRNVWVEKEPFQLNEYNPEIRALFSSASVVDKYEVNAEDYHRAVNRALMRVWKKYSQKIQHDLAKAVALREDERFKELNQEFLDVHRKMIELDDLI